MGGSVILSAVQIPKNTRHPRAATHTVFMKGARMFTFSRQLRVAAFVVGCLFPVAGFAINSEYRVLIDADNATTTGCTVTAGGVSMAGVEQVLVTSVSSNETTGTVTSVTRQVCTSGALGAPIAVSTSTWVGGVSGGGAKVSVETFLPLSALGGTLPATMRLGFVGANDLTQTVVTLQQNGSSILFPPAIGMRRHVVNPPGTSVERVIVLDGNSGDWGGVPPLVPGVAGVGTGGVRFENIRAFANADTLYFLIEGRLLAFTPTELQPPTAVNDTYSVVQGHSLHIVAPGVLGNDSDPLGRALLAALVSGASHGSLSLQSDGGFTYTHDKSLATSDTFQYKATATGGVDSNTATVTLNVTPDGAPIVAADAYNVAHGGTLTVPAPGVLFNDHDPDGDSLSAIVGTPSAPAHGTLTLNSNGGFTYTHDGSNTLTDTFGYRATDGIRSSPGTVTITVGPNQPPVAAADSFTVAEGGTLSVGAPGLLGNDTDADTPASQLQVQIVSIPANGTLTANANGSFTYVHNGSETTSDSFTYRVSDGIATSNTVTVTITVTPVNDAPVANGDAYSTTEDTVLNGTTVLANDTDAEGNALTAVLVSNGTLGNVVLNANGTFTYTPIANANGTDTFTYRASDGTGSSNVATVTITISAVNDAPAFTGGGNVTVNEDSGAYSQGWATGVTPGGGADEAGQTVSFGVTNNNNGLFSVQPAIAPNGTLSFTPAPNANGSATVTVTASDSAGASSAAQTFTITVTAVNDAPSFAAGANQSVNEDAGAQTVASFATGITPGGGADEAGQTVAFGVTNNNNALFSAQPAIAPNGTLTYTPAANASGSATVTVVATDSGGASSAPQTFTITVTPVNDAPVNTVPAAQATNEDTPLGFSSGNGNAISVADVDAASLKVTLTATNGTLTLGVTTGLTVNNNGTSVVDATGSLTSINAALQTLTFTPATDYSGPAQITILSDDQGSSGSGGALTDSDTIAITVNAVNDPPSFTGGGNVTVNEDSGAYSGTWATAISPGPANESAQTVSFTVTNDNNPLFAVQPAINAAGVLTFTPAANAFGTATVSVTANDSGGASSAAQSFTITVSGVNDAPSFTKGADQTVLEDAGTQTVAGWATAISAGPANESGQTVSFNVTNNNNGLFAVQPAVASNGTLTFTPAANANGTATVTISISDNGGTAGGGVDTSGNQTFVINVTAVNDAPSFTKGADETVLEDSGAHTVAGWATGLTAGPVDEAGQTLTFAVTGNTNPALFAVAPAVAANGTLTYTLAADAFGSATITLTLSDNGGTANGGADTSAAQTFTITVTGVNDAPSFTKGADQTVLEDSGAQSVGGWATAISPGPASESGQSVTFNVTGNTNPSLFSAGPAVAPNGTLTYTPAADANGTATITINIQDNGGTANGGADTSGSQTFVINVTAVNDAPSFTKGADQTVNEDSGAQTVNGWATSLSRGPADEGGQTLTFSATNNNNALFAVQPAIDASGNLTYTPAANVSGSATVTVTLQDNGGTANGGVDTSSQTFTITVAAVNDQPSFTKGADQTVNEDAGAQTVNGWATAINPGTNEGGQTVDFIVSNNNNALISTQPAVDASGNLTYTPAPNANGTATVSVQIHDNGGTANGGVDTSGSQTFVINVTAVNDPPSFAVSSSTVLVFKNDPAQTMNSFLTSISPGPADEVSAGQTVSFTVTNNNNALFSAQPAISSSGTLTFTPANNAAGSATVTVFATDSIGATSANQFFTITVEAAPAVTSTVPNNGSTAARSTTVTINFSEAVNATASSFDINCGAGSESFTLSASPASSFVLTPGALLPAGLCTVTVFATGITDVDTNDPAGFDNLAADFVFTFNTNTPPVANDDSYNFLGNVTLNVSAANGVIQGTGADTDPDGQPLTVTTGTVATSKGGSITFASDGSFVYTPPAGYKGASGADTATYTLSDGTSTDTAVVTLNVSKRVWYVLNNATAPGDGRDTSPFTTLAAAETASAAAASAGAVDDETIYVLAGDGTATGLNAGFTFKANQTLIGQGVGSNVTTTLNGQTVTLLSAGSAPLLARSSAGTNITLSTNNTLRGVALSTSNGIGILGTNFVSFTTDTTSVAATGERALSLNNGSVSASLTTLSSTNSAGAGMSLTTVTGSITATGGSISGASGASILVTGGSVNLTYPGNITQANNFALLDVNGGHTGTLTFNTGTLSATNGSGIQFNNADGTYVFNGTTTLNGGDAAIDITNGSSGSFTFETGTSVNNPANAAFTVSDLATTGAPGSGVIVFKGSLTKSGASAGRLVDLTNLATGTTINFAAGSTLTSTSSASTGISMNNADGGVSYNGTVTLTSGSNGVSLTNGSSGTIFFNTGTAITDPITVTAIDIANSAPTSFTMGGSTTQASGRVASVSNSAAGACGTIQFGTMTNGSGGSPLGTGILVNNCSSGTVTFGGNLSLFTGINNAVTLTGNAGANITFSSGSDSINTTTGTGMVASGGGTITITNNAHAVASTLGKALDLSGVTMAGAGAFSSVSSGGGTNGIALTNVAGSMTVNGGTLQGATGATLLVSGGTVSATYLGNITQATAAQPLVSVAGGHATGTITLNTGTLSATNGTGLQFDNADGTYSFTGPISLAGGDAGIDIQNGSGGTFIFGSGVNLAAITNPTGTGFRFNSSTGSVTYNGNVTKNGTSAGLAVDITGQSSGTISFQNGTITNSSSTGTGITLSNADGTVSFAKVTLSGGDNGIDVVGGSSGTISVTDGTSSITGPSGIAFNVNASNPTLTYPGSITNNTNRAVTVDGASTACGSITFSGGITSGTAGTPTGQGILVQNCTSGSVTFSGSSKSLFTGANKSVTLATNGSTTITFSGGGLDAHSTSQTTFDASGSGTVVVSGANNNLTNTGGGALSVSSVTIGATGMLFRSINATGGTNGILLSSTGAGVLHVTGDGSTLASGGTIQSATGDGVSLSSTTGPNLEFMDIKNNNGSGVNGNNVSGFSINRGRVTGNDLDNLGANESGLKFGTLSGTNTITNTTVSGTNGDNMRVDMASGSMTLNITSSTFGPNPVGTGANGIALVGTGTAGMTVTCTTCTFSGNQASGFLTSFANSATYAVTMTGATFSSNNIGFDFGIGGSTGSFSLTGSTFTNHTTNAINVISDAASTSSTKLTSGTISSNTITTVSGGNGIAVDMRGDAGAAVTISNNTVSGTQARGIIAESRLGITLGAGKAHFIVTGNSVGAPSLGGTEGIRVTSRDGRSTCAKLLNNNSSGSAGSFGLRLRQSNNAPGAAVFQIEGFSGDGTNAATVASYVASQNSPSTADVQTGGAGTIVAYTSGTCLSTLP
jgi:VCBS repeat-containing protein